MATEIATTMVCLSFTVVWAIAQLGAAVFFAIRDAVAAAAACGDAWGDDAVFGSARVAHLYALLVDDKAIAAATARPGGAVRAGRALRRGATAKLGAQPMERYV